jgi:hypothetical protein
MVDAISTHSPWHDPHKLWNYLRVITFVPLALASVSPEHPTTDI